MSKSTPKRYEINILVGPCDFEDAEAILDATYEGVLLEFGVADQYGAVYSLSEYDESRDSASRRGAVGGAYSKGNPAAPQNLSESSDA